MKNSTYKDLVMNNPFEPQRGVSFFLRPHRHLPDGICGAIFGPCEYRQDGEVINGGNDYVEKLRQDPEFCRKEKEIEEAVKNGKSLFISTPPNR